jgi:hypothetical protein
VFPNFDEKYVANAFSRVGNVERVDFVAKEDRDGKKYNAVYVHFNKWYINKLANNIWEKCFEKNGQTQFYHDNSDYFWIVLPNTAKKHVPGERKPRIGLGNANAINVKSVVEKKPDITNIDLEIDENLRKEYQREMEFEKLEAEMEEEYQREIELAELEAEMEEEYKKMEEEDKNLVSIDWRYVHTIEQENKYLNAEIAQLRMALINMDRMYQVEAAKLRAFSASVDL